MHQNTEEPKKEQNTFIREYIKDKPLSRRTLLLMILTAVVLGIVFGGAAALTYNLGTYAARLAADETADADEDTASADTQPDTLSEEDTDTAADTAVQETETIVQEIDTDDYQRLKYELYSIGRIAGKSIVTVSATSQGTDLFQSDYESTDQIMGLVLSSDSEEVLILTQYASLSGAEDICVVFSDDVSADAQIVGYDANIGLAVISVDTAGLSETTQGTIEAAVLKTTGSVSQGQIVVAIGSPLGSIYSILDGTVTSVTNQITPDDSVYTIYTTSMLGAEDGTGVLINTDGEVIGVMMMEYNSDSDRNTLTAVSARDLYPKIEKLMAGGSIAYLGVSISDVTSVMSEEYGMPAGVYVRDVTEDAPAYDAGIQPGDIITAIGGVQIESVDDFMENMLTHRPDQTMDVIVMRSSGDEYAEVVCSVKFSQK